MKLLCLPLLLGAYSALAQPQTPNTAAPATSNGPVGSTAFCLFALPPENGNQRWVNLGIVQYVEARADAVQITYGGGNLGSGYDAKIPVKSADEARAVMQKLRQTAEDCARRPAASTSTTKEDTR
ncbi:MULTISPECIES: hypothetical protein [Niveibacterium]|uniref:Uncharacterized protein n=1 Tax=Niveibacterium microcysteis TaxID=2811415 RepID=A0ABX7M3N2_9RHOO|nr:MULTISPECIES: hypothetical protein [Niveibacterium]QSI76359.1 hypothetical protein JY500_18115 [Niveibacterium microcysteis]